MSVDEQLARSEELTRGLDLYHQGQLEEAISAWREALRLDPSLPLAHYGIGLALSEQGQREEALQEWQRSLSLDPTQRDAHLAMGSVYAQRALQTKSRADWQAALDAYRQGLQAHPEDAALLRSVGLAEGKLGNRTAAAHALDGALRAEPLEEDNYRWVFRHQVDLGHWRGAWRTAFAQSQLPNRQPSPYPLNYRRVLVSLAVLTALIAGIGLLLWKSIHR